MDANGQRFWMLHGEQDWQQTQAAETLAYCAEDGTLQLAAARRLNLVEDEVQSEALLQLVPAAADGFGLIARVQGQRLLAESLSGGELVLAEWEPGDEVSDVLVGGDEMLYLAINGEVRAYRLDELTHTWTATATLSQPGFVAWRLAAAGHQVFVISPSGQVAHVQGELWPSRATGEWQSFRPEPETPDGLQLVLLHDGLPAGERAVAIAGHSDGMAAVLVWTSGWAGLRHITDAGLGPLVQLADVSRPYSVAWASATELVLRVTGLAEAVAFDTNSSASRLLPVSIRFPLRAADSAPWIHTLSTPVLYPTGGSVRPLHRLSTRQHLPAGTARSGTWIDAGVAGSTWHRAYLEADLPAETGGVLWVCANEEPLAPALGSEGWCPHLIGPAVQAYQGQLEVWLLSAETVAAAEVLAMRAVLSNVGAGGVSHQALSLDLVGPWQFVPGSLQVNGVPVDADPTTGWALTAEQLSGESVTLRWELEVDGTALAGAILQATCLARSRFAGEQVQEATSNVNVRAYIAAVPPSERARLSSDARYGATLSDRPLPRTARVGATSEIPFHKGMAKAHPGDIALHTVLLQKTGRRTSALKGRYLHLRLDLLGGGARTPRVAAVRVYGQRFSYVEKYLPELYHERTFGADALAPAPTTTAPDFMERFLGNFEGVLTMLEDRIAHSHQLSEPATAPSEALPWLAQWIGAQPVAGLRDERIRTWIYSAHELHRRRGTLAGLRLALDIATEGAVTRGQVLVVEDFRLRRTLATILGADLADEADELTAGIANSGNSFVGDTMILGSPWRKEFLALFNADLELSEGEQGAVDQLFERLAYRVTVLVHAPLPEEELSLVRAVVTAETPAHVASRVSSASKSLIVGLQSLVGVDTYLSRKPPPPTVQLGRSRLGSGARVQRPASFDPQLEGESE